MKNERHNRIIEMIGNHSVETQEELLKALRESGFDVTQATISRDMRELRLSKIQNEQGKTVYACPDIPEDVSQRYREIFQKAVTGMDYALNNVVIKCHVGMAGAACAALDSLKLPRIVGTLAGDDTILAVTQNEEASKLLIRELKNL